jgi:hypothetical protein
MYCASPRGGLIKSRTKMQREVKVLAYSLKVFIASRRRFPSVLSILLQQKCLGMRLRTQDDVPARARSCSQL